MFHDQHDCQASVGSKCLALQTSSHACRVVCHLASLLRKETVFLLSECRQASDRQELAHMCTCPIVDCPEPEIADQDWEFPFLCGLRTGGFVALALASILRHLCSSHVEPATLRVRRVRMNHSEDDRTERSNVAQPRISDRGVVSGSWIVSPREFCPVGMYGVTGQYYYPRNVLHLEQIMYAQ